MPAYLNRVTLIGNLGKDPETRFMPNGDAVANLSLATVESWKDKDGELQEKTEWHRVIFYRKQAEVAGKYLKKGSSVFIEGRLATRKWTDKNGRDNYITETIGTDLKMLGTPDGAKSGKKPAGKPRQSRPDDDDDEPF